MKILNDESHSNTFVLIMDKKEARTLVDMAEAAHNANKRRSSFRAWNNKLSKELCCF